MGIVRTLGILGITVAAALAVAGCEKSRDEMRPDMDKVVSGEQGLQSRDLREMTDRLAPDLMQIDPIVRSPYKIVIVMKPIENKLETDPGRDLTIYVARLKALLNSNPACRAKLAFVEDRATLQKLQGEELGNTNPDPFEEGSRTGQAPQDPRLMPQYALWGTFYEKRGAKTSYYLCTFRLTNIRSGEQAWEGSYEVKTLN